MTSVDLADIPCIRNLVQVVGHEEPLVLVSVGRLKVRWFIIGWSVFGVEHLEGRKSPLYAGNQLPKGQDGSRSYLTWEDVHLCHGGYQSLQQGL